MRIYEMPVKIQKPRALPPKVSYTSRVLSEFLTKFFLLHTSISLVICDTTLLIILVSMPFPVEKTCPLPFPQTRSAPFEYSWGSTSNNFPTALFSPVMRQDHLSSYVALPPSQTPFVLGPASDRPSTSS